ETSSATIQLRTLVMTSSRSSTPGAVSASAGPANTSTRAPAVRTTAAPRTAHTAAGAGGAGGAVGGGTADLLTGHVQTRPGRWGKEAGALSSFPIGALR